MKLPVYAVNLSKISYSKEAALFDAKWLIIERAYCKICDMLFYLRFETWLSLIIVKTFSMYCWVKIFVTFLRLPNNFRNYYNIMQSRSYLF